METYTTPKRDGNGNLIVLFTYCLLVLTILRNITDIYK